MRCQYGPPADYHPGSFGEGNVYYIPALMWDLVRQRLGTDEFWRLSAGVAGDPPLHQPGPRHPRRLVEPAERPGPEAAVPRLVARRSPAHLAPGLTRAGCVTDRSGATRRWLPRRVVPQRSVTQAASEVGARSVGWISTEQNPLTGKGRRPQKSSAVAGSSRMPATSARKREPFSPSMWRWSKDSASVVTWRDHDLVARRSTTHGCLLDRAEAQDRGLARVDDRRARVDAEDADVGDRERAAAHLGRLGLAPRGRSR